MIQEISNELSGKLLSLEEVYPKYSILPIIPRNIIIYGAPGTGKSKHLEEKIKLYFFENPSQYTRVTFYPSYNYSHFMGTYKPVPVYLERNADITMYHSDTIKKLTRNLEPMIDYKFVPGPFIDLLCKALSNPHTNFLLIIEEINRTNAAGVFGDVFQLLDRNENGESDYTITLKPEMMEYLMKNGIFDTEIKLPSNLFIWATMNSADQGVQPMDTAFLRRWSLEYLGLNDKNEITDKWTLNLNYDGQIRVMKWNRFRKIINEKLDGKVPEDKLIGPFFLKKQELLDEDTLINKLFFYLKESVFKHNSSLDFFKASSFSKLIEQYKNKENVFRFEIEERDFEK